MPLTSILNIRRNGNLMREDKFVLGHAVLGLYDSQPDDNVQQIGSLVDLKFSREV